MNAIWMHPWDLDGEDPAALADELRSIGLDACRLAFKYHGGRVLLPRREPGRVLELEPGGVYFEPDPERFRSLRLRPRPVGRGSQVPRFIDACKSAGLEVEAWTVFCHDDQLGAAHLECCVRNVLGDRYSYALCPSHPDVRAYASALAADVCSRPGIARLDAEALGFLGYTHNSLHDKAGVPLTEEIRWLLSICDCDACRTRIGPALEEAAERARSRLKRYFADPEAGSSELHVALAETLGENTLDALLLGRRSTVASLAREVRTSLSGTPLDLRFAPDPLFVGGKSALGWDDLDGRTDSVTVTFFGAALSQIEAHLDRLPPPEQRTVPIRAGIVFHYPDCGSEQDLQDRYELLRAAGLYEISFYSLGMATSAHLRWLATTVTDVGLRVSSRATTLSN